jgi:hypothetical protein
MARLFRTTRKRLRRRRILLSRIAFTLDDLKYEYPHEPVPPGWEPQDWLEHMVMEAAKARFPKGVPALWRKTIDEEFRLIRAKGYAYYFLTVHDIVRHACSLDPPILCQGRGSAANSVVCYLLGITPVDRSPTSCSSRAPLRRATNRPISMSISSMSGAKSDAIYLPALWPRPRRDRRDGDPLPPAQHDPRGGQGAGAD